MPRQASDPYADLALSTWLDELAADRRVLWVGDAASDAPDRLARGARSVLVLAPHPPPKRESQKRGARISALKPGPLAFRPGSFDVVVVPDLGAVGLADGARLDELREVTGEQGVLVAGTPAEDGVGYEALFELLAERFPMVRMLGQAAFAGYAVVDLEAAQADPEVTFDGSLAGEQPAERWLAVASADGPSLDAYCVIQVPGTERPVAAPRRTRRAPEEADDRAARLEEELRQRQSEVDAANEHAEALELTLAERSSEVEELRDALDVRERELESLRGAITRLEEARREEAARPEEPEARPDEVAADIDRLEQALSAQGGRVLELEREVSRRGTLVRDLVEELRELRAAGAREAASASSEELDAAVERAVAAEAARAEAQFQIDELMGRLAQAGDPEELAALRLREARLSGTVRGLRARLAEAEELRELAEGRLAVTELDLDDQRRQSRQLERDLGELREQYELELVRARGPAETRGEVSEREAELRASETNLSRRVGELSGQLVACRDLLSQASDDRDHARAETLRLTALVGSLEDQFSGARRGYEARIAELLHDSSAEAEREVSRARAELAEVRGERDGLSARLADREAALAARATASVDDVEQARAEAGRLRGELERLRREAVELSARATDAEDRARRESEGAAELSANTAVRESLVTRLQMELADEERRRQELTQRLARADEENERLRSALLDASEQVDEALAAEDRKDRLQRRRRLSDTALVETRGILVELAEAIGEQVGPAPREITAVGLESPDLDAPMRARVEELEDQLADQETLMRSLTAQIEERDDRIRALERRLEGSVGVEGDEETLRRELMELQERAARLSDELLHERRARRNVELDARKRSGASDDDVRRLHERLGQTDAELLLLRGQQATTERDLRSIRDACSQVRNGLEGLLGAATANGDPATADRIGTLIRLLNRF